MDPSQHPVGNMVANCLNINFPTFLSNLIYIDCNEVVGWVIAKKILKVKGTELNALRSLKTYDDKTLADNFRPTQRRNGRNIVKF